MNKCFFIGKIISDIDFRFVLNNRKIQSVVKFKIKLDNNSILNVIGYNEIADYCYQEYSKNLVICLEGRLESNLNIEIIKIEEFR